MKQPKFLVYIEAIAGLMFFAWFTQSNPYIMILLSVLVVFAIEAFYQEINENEMNHENRELQMQLRFKGKDAHLKNKQLMTIVASIPFPILLLDEAGNIAMHNNIDSLSEHHKEDVCYTYLANDFHYNVHEFVKDAYILEEEITKVIDIQGVEYQAISVPVLAKSKYSGSLVLFQDISKTLEGEKMQKRFIADASHELKTPIAVIKGMIEILNRDDFDDEQIQKDFLQQIDSEINRLESLVKDLLQLSKLSMNNIVLERKRYHIADCMKSAIALMERSAQAKNIEIQTDFKTNEVVFIDVRKMEQVFMNLISNAIKYSDQGPMIVRTYKDDIYCVCEIEDHGKGMKPHHTKYIFDRFYRIHDDRSRQSGGSGLGLSIVKSICDAHRIEIEVESEYQKGTIFRLRIRA